MRTVVDLHPVAAPGQPAPATPSPRRAEERRSSELERLRERLSLVGRAARVGIWEYDFERDELWVSEELAALYGLRPEEFTWPEFTRRLHPDDVVAPLERPTPSYPFGAVNEFFFRVRHADGTYRSIRSRSTTEGRDGVPLRKYGAHIDMSEDALLRLAHLSESNERLRQFAYMASHDLRSPLRSIRGLLDVVLDRHGDELSDDARELVDSVIERAGQLDRLVVDMLDYAAADIAEEEIDPTDVEALIREVVATTDRRQCRIVVDTALTEPIEVAARPLAACVRNLVDNACKYHDKPSGTVTISAGLDDPHWLRIRVADDGPGIPSWIEGRLFEPFQTSDPVRGTGLGLAHVRKTVDKHDGSLDVITGPETGTTFTIRWPVACADRT